MTDRRADSPAPVPRPRWKRRLAIACICIVAVVLLTAGGAVLAWQKRTDLLAWGVAAYLEGDNIQAVSLDVVAVERDHLLVRNIRIVGAQRITADTLTVDYTFNGFIRGTIDSLTLSGLRVDGVPAPLTVNQVKGDGTFRLTPFTLDRLTVGLDLLRMRIGDQHFDPSRVEIAYHDRTLVLESAFTAPDGYVTALGSGPLDQPAKPFRLLLSGRLNARLAALPIADVADAAGHLAFSVSARVSDPLYFLGGQDTENTAFPGRFAVDGTIQLALDRLTVLETPVPTAPGDKLQFQVESAPGDTGTLAGTFDVTAEFHKRETPEIGFDAGEAHLAGKYTLDGSTLSLAIADGPLMKLSEMRLAKGLPVPGDIALQLLGGGNKATIDLADKTVSHSLESRLSWKNGELSLRSQGHLSDPQDPTVFTLRGAFDATPLLALVPQARSATGDAHLFLAGRVSQPLLLFQAPSAEDQRPWDGDIRLDGAVQLDTTGLTIPGAAPSPKAKDSLEIILKSFNDGDTQPGGRLAVNATLDTRRFGGWTVDQAKLALEGRLSYGTRGYRFVPGTESVLNIKSLRSDTGVVIPDGINFQLTGTENQVTVPADLSAVYHALTLAHIEADGYVETDRKTTGGKAAGKKGAPKRRPFIITLPKITSRNLENGTLAVYLTGGTIDLPDDKLIARSVNASLEQTAEGYDIGLETGDIRDGNRPPMTTPLALAAKGEIRGNRLTATANLRQLYSPLKIVAKIRHDLATSAGRMDFTVPRTTFGTKKASLYDIFPPAAAWVTSSKGTASAIGHLLWDKDILSGQMTVDVDGVDLTTKDVRFSDVTGTVNFIELIPLSMPPRQRLKGKIATGELGPWPMQVEFQLQEDGTFEVQDLDIAMADGVVRTRAVVDPSAHGAADGSVQLRSVDLHELLALIGVEGLNGTGRITGTVPIRIEGGKVAIADGLLKAEGPGVLRYHGTALQEKLSARGDTVGTVADVLSDFRYETLSMELKKAPNGEGTIMLRMEGANPKVLDGHPFAFNIKIESDFDKLGRIAQGGLKSVTDVIQRSGATGTPGQ